MATGLISGTPTGTPGSYTFTVQVTDAAASTATRQLTLTTAGGSAVLADSATETGVLFLSNGPGMMIVLQGQGSGTQPVPLSDAGASAETLTIPGTQAVQLSDAGNGTAVFAHSGPLTNRPAQPFAVCYGGAGNNAGASAYESPGGLVIVSQAGIGDQVFKDISAAGGTVLLYLDIMVIQASGGQYYDQLLMNSSAYGAAVPPWPGNYTVNTGLTLADFRTAADGGGVLQSKLSGVLGKMAADNPHIGGFFMDDLGSQSWYPGLPWSSFPDQQKWYNGAVAACQTIRSVCNTHDLIFIVNGTWNGGTVASSGGGYPTLGTHGNALADGGFVEHHDGQISYFGPYAASAQWASQSAVTSGTSFMMAVMNSSAGVTEYSSSGDYAYVQLQTDYTVIPAPGASFHYTGLPAHVT